MQTWIALTKMILTASLIVLEAEGVSCAADRAAAAEEIDRLRPIYHPDREHLWNRLHEALFVRIGPDGNSYGHDRLEPLLWTRSKHLLEPRSCARAVRLLDEFLERRGERLINDALKRALLQRDVWLVFNWVVGYHGEFADPQLGDWQSSQQQLRNRLAYLIGRLVLTSEEVSNLPNNYEAAIGSGEFATAYDPEDPERPYLPPDFFVSDSHWVCLGRADGPIAPMHVRDENPFTNSAFLLFLRLPGGRAATLAYVDELRSFDEPLMIRAHRDALIPNPDVPQVPHGTEIALIRRALLVASPANLIASPLTESIQLRRYRQVPSITAELLHETSTGGATTRHPLESWQIFQEFRFSRPQLFTNDSGGLRVVSRDERDFKTGFGAHPWDEFERASTADEPFPDRGHVNVKQSCVVCHSLPGVYSFNSFFNFRTATDPERARPAELIEMKPSAVLRTAVSWKEERPEWKYLRSLISSERRAKR